MNRWQHASLVSITLLLLASCTHRGNSPAVNNSGGNGPVPLKGKDTNPVNKSIPGNSNGDEGTITVGTTQKPRTLDPADAYELR